MNFDALKEMQENEHKAQEQPEQERQEVNPYSSVMLKAISEVYTRYNITDEEDALVSTFGMHEEDAKQQIIETSTPERAKELLKASDELKTIIDGFIEHMKKQITGEDLQEQQKQQDIPRVKAVKTNGITYPLDKLNSTVFNAPEYARRETAPSLKAESKESGRAGKTADIQFYLTNFDELTSKFEITTPLTMFDKFVYFSIAELYTCGNEYITATQIHHAMGKQDKPSPEELQRIEDSVEKMRDTKVYINNELENNLYPKYPKIVYDDYLLSCRRERAYINGKLTETTYKVGNTPILFDYAQKHKQISYIPRPVLNSPERKTEKALQLNDYLFKRIAPYTKSGKKDKELRIVFKTLYDALEITNRTERSRTKDKISNWLEYQIKQGYVKSFEMQKDRVKIIAGTAKRIQ